MLDRLSKQPYRVLEHGFDRVFHSQVSQARKQRLFSHSIIVAIDFTDIEWYGEELPFIVKGKSKNGTDRFIRFATAGIVEDGKRFTLKVLPVTPLSCKEKIVKDLINFVQKLVSIRVLLLDRGFYCNEVVQEIKKMKHCFVIPAKKYDKVKQLMKTAYKDGPQQYEMSKGATYILVYLFTGPFGVLILGVATAIGLLPVEWGVRRSHCMGVLLLPIMLYFL